MSVMYVIKTWLFKLGYIPGYYVRAPKEALLDPVSIDGMYQYPLNKDALSFLRDNSIPWRYSGVRSIQLMEKKHAAMFMMAFGGTLLRYKQKIFVDARS